MGRTLKGTLEGRGKRECVDSVLLQTTRAGHAVLSQNEADLSSGQRKSEPMCLRVTWSEPDEARGCGLRQDVRCGVPAGV